MNRIRIAIDLTPLLSGGANGGVKPAILAFIRALQNLENPSFSFCFITSGSSHREIQSITTDRDEVISIASLKSDASFGPSFFSKRRVNILYAPFGRVRFPNCGVPVVSMVVDLLHRDYPHSIPQAEREWRERYFAGMVSRANRFQVISDYTGERLAHHYGLPAEKIFRTYLPIQDRLSVGKVPISSGKPFFFYPANFWPHKNHEILLISYQIYRSRVGAEGWDLVLTGSNEVEHLALLNLVQSLGIEKYVIFKGHLPENELASLFAGASALVFPSLHEGFGIPPLEAMKLGVPVLTSDAGSLKEVVGDAALMVDPKKPIELAAAMEKLASSKELQADLIRRGYERADSFSFSAEVAKLADVFVEEASIAKKLTLSQRLQREFALARTNSVLWSHSAVSRLRNFLRNRV
jgi:glycosyltransferase involved in cell wall biosynthesis